MKKNLFRTCILWSCWLTLLAGMATAGVTAESKAKTTKKSSAKTQVGKKEATAAKANPIENLRTQLAALPKSSFSPNDGTGAARNPFFPKAQAAPAAVAKNNTSEVDTTAFVLNGITGPPMRSAMINGRTFLQGEEGEVRIQTGAKVLIRCAEIGDERAVIEVSGIRKELRLRLGI